MKNSGVEGAGTSPEVITTAKLGGSDEVAWWIAGKAWGVKCRGKGDGLGKADGHWNAGDAVAGEDEGGDVAGMVRGLGVAEDGTVGVTDEDDAVEYLACGGVSPAEGMVIKAG